MKIAAAQSAVTIDPVANGSEIRALMREAAAAGDPRSIDRAAF